MINAKFAISAAAIVLALVGCKPQTAPTPPAGPAAARSGTTPIVSDSSAPVPPPAAPAAEHILVSAADLKWVDAPAALPKGAKIVVIEGDPSKAGPFTMRLQLPPNYKIAPHFHPAIEHVTVLSGTFYLGQGSEFNETALKSLAVGGFAVMPSGMQHFAQTKDAGVILQLHGVGPWGLTYVNPADDPRQANQ